MIVYGMDWERETAVSVVASLSDSETVEDDFSTRIIPPDDYEITKKYEMVSKWSPHSQ